jgi:hypothetical protein
MGCDLLRKLLEVNKPVKVTNGELKGNTGMLEQIFPKTNKFPILYLVRFPDGSEFTYDSRQIKRLESTEEQIYLYKMIDALQ